MISVAKAPTQIINVKLMVPKQKRCEINQCMIFPTDTL